MASRSIFASVVQSTRATRSAVPAVRTFASAPGAGGAGAGGAGGASADQEAVLAAVRQRWKQARLAKDSSTATVLGVRVCVYVQDANLAGHPGRPAVRAQDQGAAEPKATVDHQDAAEGHQEAHRRGARVPERQAGAARGPRREGGAGDRAAERVPAQVVGAAVVERDAFMAQRTGTRYNIKSIALQPRCPRPWSGSARQERTATRGPRRRHRRSRSCRRQAQRT